jgi:hypothetical protein
MLRCLGVLREVQNSPNRETDDALILKAVLTQLQNLGVETQLASPDEFDFLLKDLEPGQKAPWDMVIPMCEAYPRLRRMSQLFGEDAPFLINPPQAVLNCYRTRMTPILSKRPGVSFPPTEIRAAAEGAGSPPVSFPAPEGWWIKRGDVHNTCDRDVVRARAWSEVPAILGDFSHREILHWIVQPHIDGDLVKFYGVGPGRWFTWFYHDPVRAHRIPFRLSELADQASAAARALGLEVFGGDAIISPGGRLTLIDLNSWPSFALVRNEAAVQISWHVQNRLLASSQAFKGALK